MAQSFTRRVIEVTIKLAANSQTTQPAKFSESGTDTVTLSSSRTSVRIQNSGSPAGSTASVDVWGLTPSIMNQLSTLGLAYNYVPKNTCSISAGDDQGGKSAVYAGTITAGYGNYDGAPDVPFHMECNSGLSDNVVPATPSSFQGSTDVATIMSGFARQMNKGFENNGVNVKLSAPYFSGNLWTQVQACADHANINAEIINGNILAIWPKGKSRNTSSIPLISKDTGMIGYPAYTQQGIIVRSVFNPQIAFGGKVKVQSALKPIDEVAEWAIYKMDLALDAQVPRGQWMQTCYCFNPKYPHPIPK